MRLHQILITVICLIILSSFLKPFDNFASNPKTLNVMADSTTFQIEGKSVSKKEFDTFLVSLKEIKGTWFCGEAMDGGTVGYNGEENGVVYEYQCTSMHKKNRCTITKIIR